MLWGQAKRSSEGKPAEQILAQLAQGRLFGRRGSRGGYASAGGDLELGEFEVI